MFKLTHPADTYELNLSDAYQRAICIKLLSIVATDSFYELENIQYKPPQSHTFTPLSLAPSTYTVPESQLDDEQGKFSDKNRYGDEQKH